MWTEVLSPRSQKRRDNPHIENAVRVARQLRRLTENVIDSTLHIEDELERAMGHPVTPPRGEPMPQTREYWEKRAEYDQELILTQKAEISDLKQKLNRAQQRIQFNDAVEYELALATTLTLMEKHCPAIERSEVFRQARENLRDVPFAVQEMIFKYVRATEKVM